MVLRIYGSYLISAAVILCAVPMASYGQLPPPPPTPRGCPASGCGSDSSNNGGSRSNNSRTSPGAAEIAARDSYVQNELGVAAFNKGDWATAEICFKKALEYVPDNTLNRKNLAITLDHEGQDAYRASNYATALNYFQQALANDPPDDLNNNHIMREDLAATQGKIANAQREQEQRQKDKIAAANTQQSIQRLAQTLNAAPSSGGLDFMAGDQLLSAAASSDLTTNYDRGGAKEAGSLKIPAKHSIDPATFSPKVKNDPRMVTALKQLDALTAKRTQLSAELERLTVARNLEKDPQKSQDLTSQLNQKHDDVQANLLSITKAEATVEKTKRTIETEVETPKTPAGKL